MKEKSSILNFESIIEPVSNEIDKLVNQSSNFSDELETQSKELNELVVRLQSLSKTMKFNNDEIINNPYFEFNNIVNLNFEKTLNSKKLKFKKFPELSAQDLIACIISGTISIIIDVVFVGTPDVVKLSKGGQQFDGSILTENIRNLGKEKDDPTYGIFKWLSDKCKVPYDISAITETLSPNNHRLRSLAHDPYFGLLFAIADIILGTTTCINNKGILTLLVNEKDTPITTKYLSVIYYLGHIISDINTSRGIPIPGFFLTQFFTNEVSDSSIAKIAEDMYINGNDLRHLASMSTPVYIKDMIIELYLKLNNLNSEVITSIADREKIELDKFLKKQKMLFITNLISTTGNTVKFLAPPSCGNPNSINIVQWMELIKNSITMVSAYTRDTTTEEVMLNRKNIDCIWDDLISQND